MASTIDSGVDTGNDSNDSSVQEKLSKMDVENSPQSKSLDPAKETTSKGDQDDQKQPHSSSEIVLVDSGPGMSLTHLQPSSLMHGYEYHPPPPPPDSCGRNLNCVLFNVMNSNNEIGGVFVSGGPFGTEYKGNELLTKMHHSTCITQRRDVLRFKCMRKYSVSRNLANHNYAKVRDTMRMCRAACTNNTEAMRGLLDSGLSPNCHDSYKRTPLHLASCMGFADMVKLLLDYGADPNAKDSIGNTPLHLAACTNHVSVITLLLKAGTRVSERDLAGHSPLQLAITKFNIMKRSIMPHPVLKEQVCQVITMLTEYMKRKEGTAIDPDLLNKFESLVRVSDSSEEVETNIRDLLNNLSSLSLSSTS